jgi:hypothetical protein
MNMIGAEQTKVTTIHLTDEQKKNMEKALSKRQNDISIAQSRMKRPKQSVQRSRRSLMSERELWTSVPQHRLRLRRLTMPKHERVMPAWFAVFS